MLREDEVINHIFVLYMYHILYISYNDSVMRMAHLNPIKLRLCKISRS